MYFLLGYQLIIHFSGNLTHHFGLSAPRQMRRCRERGWGGSLEKRTGTPGMKAFKGFNLNLCGKCVIDMAPKYKQMIHKNFILQFISIINISLSTSE